MRFAEPLWLLLALPAAGAAWFLYHNRARSRAAMLFPAAGGLRSTSTIWDKIAQRLPEALKLASLLLMAAALARPQKVMPAAADVIHGISIMMVMDTSISMRALDFDPRDRMAAAKDTAKRFIEGRSNDAIGLTVFGGASMLACPLTLDHEALLDTLSEVESGMTGVDGTAIGDGIATGVSHLQNAGGKSRVMILLTDGRSNRGVIDPLTAAKAAESFGIKIYAIGTGKRGQSFIPVDTAFGRQMAKIDDDLDEASLTKIAEATGGRYYRATNFEELKKIYDEIDRLERAERRSPPAIAGADLHHLFLVPAILLLALQFVAARTLLLRIP